MSFPIQNQTVIAVQDADTIRKSKDEIADLFPGIGRYLRDRRLFQKVANPQVTRPLPISLLVNPVDREPRDDIHFYKNVTKLPPIQSIKLPLGAFVFYRGIFSSSILPSPY